MHVSGFSNYWRAMIKIIGYDNEKDEQQHLSKLYSSIYIYIYINISRDRDRLVKCEERWARNSLDKTTEGLSDYERRVIVTYCKPISKVVHCFGWIVSEFVVFEACRLLAICLTAVDGNLCKSVNRFTRSDSVRILRGCHSTFYQHFINILFPLNWSWKFHLEKL